MLVFPGGFAFYKIILLSLLLCYASFELVKVKKIKTILLIGLLSWYSYMLFSLLNGVLNGFSIDIFLLQYYFLTPIAAFLLSYLFKKEEQFIYLNNMLILIAFFIAIIDIIYILYRMNIFFYIPLFDSPMFGSSVVKQDYIEFRVYNQTSLIFLIPYIFTLLQYSKNKIKKGMFIILVIGCVLNFIVIMLSGRRAWHLAFILVFS